MGSVPIPALREGRFLPEEPPEPLLHYRPCAGNADWVISFDQCTHGDHVVVTDLKFLPLWNI